MTSDYTVWINTDGYNNWTPSDPLPDLDAVLKYITSSTYGHPYVVTQEVLVQLSIAVKS